MRMPTRHALVCTAKKLKDCENYQVYLSEFSDEHYEHMNGD
jgi:hypothetical protein